MLFVGGGGVERLRIEIEGGGEGRKQRMEEVMSTLVVIVRNIYPFILELE